MYYSDKCSSIRTKKGKLKRQKQNIKRLLNANRNDKTVNKNVQLVLQDCYKTSSKAMFPFLPPTFKPVNNLSFLQDKFDAVNSSTTLFFWFCSNVA